jgi:hypothetical protein
MIGAKNPRWNGGVKIHDCGYRLIASPNHPNKDKQGYVREHRLVMESILGRFLLPTEDIHHIDGNKQNNTPANLELFSSRSKHIIARHREGGIKGWFKKGVPSLHKKGVIHDCEWCGNQVFKSPANIKKHIYCSKPCFYNSLRKYVQ